MCSNKDNYDMYKSQVDREDSLVNSRFGWALTLQGFLFASLAVLAKSTDVVPEISSLLKMIVPKIGVASSLAVLATVIMSYRALWKLQEEWFQNYEGVIPSPFGNQKRNCSYLWNALSPNVLFPVILFIAWVIIEVRI
ncbi:hypothetical protein [Pseudoalteromonas rubra]|nr:hypothetical protein [Pseudoalteromonas rubra]